MCFPRGLLTALLIAALGGLTGCATAPMTAQDRDEARRMGGQDRSRMDEDARYQRRVDYESSK